MSIDYLKAFLVNKKIYFEELHQPYKKCRWKWLIRFNNIEVYMLNSCRFFVLFKDEKGCMADFTLHINSKFELIKYLEDKL